MVLKQKHVELKRNFIIPWSKNCSVQRLTKYQTKFYIVYKVIFFLVTTDINNEHVNENHNEYEKLHIIP